MLFWPPLEFGLPSPAGHHDPEPLRSRCPPATGAGGDQEGLPRQELGEVVAEAVDLGLEAVVEHVADHRHAAPHPLAGAAEFAGG